MAKANVNIENVDSFRQGIESQRDSVVDSVDMYNATIDETKEALMVEKEKAVTLIGEVQSTLSVLLSKIEEQRAKVEELQASLAALEASEPEEYETVYEPDVTDDEGNVISEGGSYEVETAAHIAWRNEVDKLSSELANEEDRLAQMEEVESKLQAVASKLEEQQAKLDELYAELEGSQEEVNARRGEIESYSESVIEKLNKISSVLQEYLSTTIGVPNSISTNNIFVSRNNNYGFSYAKERVNSTGINTRFDGRKDPTYNERQALECTKDNFEAFVNNHKTIEHITERHISVNETDFQQRIRQNSTFLPSVTMEKLKSILKEAVNSSINDIQYQDSLVHRGRGNRIVVKDVYYYDTGQDIGVWVDQQDRSNKRLTSGIKIVIDKETRLITMYPWYEA